jgi:hypothetical protein
MTKMISVVLLVLSCYTSAWSQDLYEHPPVLPQSYEVLVKGGGGPPKTVAFSPDGNKMVVQDLTGLTCTDRQTGDQLSFVFFNRVFAEFIDNDRLLVVWYNHAELQTEVTLYRFADLLASHENVNPSSIQWRSSIRSFAPLACGMDTRFYGTSTGSFVITGSELDLETGREGLTLYSVELGAGASTRLKFQQSDDHQ